jgi:hypothetical protein
VLEQRVVLHVPRAELDDVGHLDDLIEAFGIHRFRDDQQAGLVAGPGEQLEARASQPLERVGRAPGLERPRTEHRRPGLPDGAGGLENLALAFD